MIRWVGPAALAAGLAMPANAGIPVLQPMTCAIGGESFAFETTASYSTFSERPDGRPYGSWIFPLALPVCPGNGLVMFRPFTDDEKARLLALLARAGFKALAGETAYYGAWWLEKALAPGSDEAAWLLLSAVWQASDEPPRPANAGRRATCVTATVS